MMRILVVDDNEMVCDGVKAALSAYEVTTVHTMQEGLELVDRGPDTWDLVLIDLRLYPVWGPGLVEAIRDRSARLHGRTLLWTGNSLRERERTVLKEKYGVPVVDKLDTSADWLRRLVSCVEDGCAQDDIRWPI
jgi:DNA-binding response OmpR family regulator